VSQQINLFNPVFLKQKKAFSAVNMLQSIGIVCALQLALLAYGHFVLAKLESDAASGKTALDAKRAEFDRTLELFKPRQRNPALDVEIAQVQADIAALKRVEAVLNQGSLGNTQGYSGYFQAFARQNVSGLWLLGVSIIGAGVDMSVHGRAMQAALVPAYIQRLTGESVMSGISFADLQIERPSASVQAPVALPGVAATPASAGTAPFVEFRLQSRRIVVEKK